MAAINRTPPQPPQWQLTISENERGYLLAAFDFARCYLEVSRNDSAKSSQWPHAASHYLREIGHIEQVVASADPKDLRNA